MPGYKAFREQWVNEAKKKKKKDMYMIMQMQPTNHVWARKGDTTGHKCKKRFRKATCCHLQWLYVMYEQSQNITPNVGEMWLHFSASVLGETRHQLNKHLQ